MTVVSWYSSVHSHWYSKGKVRRFVSPLPWFLFWVSQDVSLSQQIIPCAPNWLSQRLPNDWHFRWQWFQKLFEGRPFYSKHLRTSVTRLRHAHRRSSPTDRDRSGILLVLLTCARILRSRIYGPTNLTVTAKRFPKPHYDLSLNLIPKWDSGSYGQISDGLQTSWSLFHLLFDERDKRSIRRPFLQLFRTCVTLERSIP